MIMSKGSIIFEEKRTDVGTVDRLGRRLISQTDILVPSLLLR
jgi:hypothetical protein